MKRLLSAMMFLSFLPGCGGGFSVAEHSLIRKGSGDIMRVLVTTNKSDSLLLRQKSEPLDENMVRRGDFKRLCRRMLATVQNPENEGVGIAAPQVGVLRRLVAVQRFDKEGEPFEFFVNPEIVEYGQNRESGGEGCLSVPDRRGQVVRSQSIKLRYRDVDFRLHEEYVEGFTAVIFQHEIDHLDGILYIDREE